MALLSRDQVKPAPLPSETHPMPSLGGDVIVRGALTSSRLELELANAGQAMQLKVLVPKLLAMSVVDANGQPLFTEEEWNEHGAQHYAECIGLFNVAMRLWGFDGEANRKNSQAAPT